MGYTKRQFIQDAFDEIGLAFYVFDLSADQLQSALRKLDRMMQMWNGKGIRVGYPSPSSPSTSSLDTETNVPDSVNEGVVANLAIRLAPSYGKTVSLETKKVARESYNELLSRAVTPGQMQLPSMMPAGAGNKPWRTTVDPFLPDPEDPIETGTDGVLNFY